MQLKVALNFIYLYPSSKLWKEVLCFCVN